MSANLDPAPLPPRSARRWWLGALALVVFATTAVTSFVDLSAVFPRFGVTRDPVGWFEEHRDEFEEAAEWSDGRCCVDDGSSIRLPDHLDHLSDNGRVHGGEGRFFFPQWFGIPDDAGGFWYSPDGRPGDMAVFGTGCFSRELLDDEWLSCGM